MAIVQSGHSISTLWTDPMALLWDPEAKQPRGGWMFFMGPTWIFIGFAIIAEDWFGLGDAKTYSKDSASIAEKQRAALEYDRDLPKRLPSSTSRS